ncbi:DUF7009 family protein [Mucilaginibacter terrae]|uniref:DUF7009 family protein n=1 Tax=Mucilaginibacter terrae TaxID=1955052 RepID=UPI003642AF8F
MKIRIRSNSLRYRLTRSEVEQFAREGVFKEKVTIGDESLVYLLQRTAELEVRATLHTNLITLLVPESIAHEWITTDKVGFDTHNGLLHILVEKDFTCLDNIEEDQSDNYPNPLAEKRL